MEYLGWDCAYRTLAFCHLTIEPANIPQGIDLINYDCADILGGPIKNFSVAERARALAKYLDNSPVSAEALRGKKIKVLVERQPAKIFHARGAINLDSAVVASQLVFYYRDFDVAYIDSKEKNKIALVAGLEHVKTGGTEKERKTERKGHTARNFAWLLENTAQEAKAPIKASLHNHIGDALMQCVAHCKKNNAV